MYAQEIQYKVVLEKVLRQALLLENAETHSCICRGPCVIQVGGKAKIVGKDNASIVRVNVIHITGGRRKCDPRRANGSGIETAVPFKRPASGCTLS